MKKQEQDIEMETFLLLKKDETSISLENVLKELAELGFFVLSPDAPYDSKAIDVFSTDKIFRVINTHQNTDLSYSQVDGIFYFYTVYYKNCLQITKVVYPTLYPFSQYSLESLQKIIPNELKEKEMADLQKNKIQFQNVQRVNSNASIGTVLQARFWINTLLLPKELWPDVMHYDKNTQKMNTKSLPDYDWIFNDLKTSFEDRLKCKESFLRFSRSIPRMWVMETKNQNNEILYSNRIFYCAKSLNRVGTYRSNGFIYFESF